MVIGVLVHERNLLQFWHPHRSQNARVSVQPLFYSRPERAPTRN